MDAVLTRSKWPWSTTAGKDGRRRARARRRSADADGDEDAGVDLRDPGPIPCTGRGGTARRSDSPASIYLGRLLTAAIRGGLRRGGVGRGAN